VPGGSGGGTHGRAGAGGRFRLALPRTPWRGAVWAAADGHGAAIVRPAADGDALTVRLTARAVLSGRVLDLDGRPIGGARVRWIGIFDGLVVERATVAKPDGRYELEVAPDVPPLVPPSHTAVHGAQVEARAGGYAPVVVEPGFWRHPAPDRLVLDLYLGRGASARGRVVDAETGTPLPGARVVAWATDARPRLGSAPSPLAHRPLAETRTDEAGRFAVAHLPARGFHDSRAGFPGRTAAFVGAERTGYARGRTGVPLLEEGGETEVTIRLWPAARIRGRVVDHKGRPVAGRRVWTSTRGPAAGAWPGALYGEPHAVRTAADGSYPWRTVPVGRKPTVVNVLTNGIHRVSLEAKAGERRVAPDLVLPQAPVRPPLVRVVDAAGDPLAGASVETIPGRRAFTTDAQGRAPVRRPDKGEYAVIARATGFAPASTGRRRAAEQEPELTLVLRPGHRLRGRVVDAEGNPVAGARVSVRDGRVPWKVVRRANARRLAPGLPALHHYGATLTDARGAFRFLDLPPGPYHVHAHGQDAPRSGVRENTTGVVLRLPFEQRPPPCARLVGTVVAAPDGDPLARFDVTLREGRPNALGGMPPARRVAPGRFAAGNLEPGPHTVTVKADGFVPATEVVDVAKDGETQLRVVLARGATVSGTVKDGLPRTRILLRAADGRETPARRLDRTGRFEFRGVPPGTWRPVLDASGTTRAPRGFPLLHVTGAGTHELEFESVRGLDLHVDVEGGAARVHVKGAGFEAAWTSAKKIRATVPAGGYTVEAIADGRRAVASVEVRPDASIARVVLVPR